MQAMREMQEKISRDGTSQERQALVAERMTLVRGSMVPTGGMGPGTMGGTGAAGAASNPDGYGHAPADDESVPGDDAIYGGTMMDCMEMQQARPGSH